MSFSIQSPNIIRQLLVYGAYNVSEPLDDSGVAIFYGEYENVMELLEIPLVPLRHDAQKRCFYIDPKFLAKANPRNLELFRKKVEERCRQFDDEIESEEEEDDFIAQLLDENQKNDNGNEELWPELPYSIPDDSYAQVGIDHLFGRLAHREMPDEYGLIGNRRAYLLQEIVSLLDQYAIPRFPIEFNKEGMPYFVADDKEIALMIMLYSERDALITEEDRKIDEHLKLCLAMAEEDIPASDMENYKEQLEIKAANEKLALLAELQEQWLLENKNYDFPTSLKTHSVESYYAALQHKQNKDSVLETMISQDYEDTTARDKLIAKAELEGTFKGLQYVWN
jgi:hypothetical protein